MELAISLGLLGWIAVIVGALVFGALAQLIGEAETRYEWFVDAIGAGVGAIIASEFIVAWQSWGPMYDGLAIVPALIGGLVVGVVVAIVARYTTGRTHAPVAA